MNDLIRRKDVEQMLTALGGCDASDKEAEGWDMAIDAALYGLRTIKNEDNTQYKWTPFTFDENGELDCKIPEEDEEVLISDGEAVWLDVFRYDEEGYYFEWKGGLIDGVAWQPKSKPYREGKLR